MKRFILGLAALLHFGVAVAAPNYFSGCRDQFNQGEPPKFVAVPSLKTRALCFDGFAVLHSGQSKTPLWVAKRLNRESLLAAQKVQRTNRFYAEARLPSAERSTLQDYKNSGYDRGHMAPAGDMSTDNEMAQSFSLANIVPQNPQHNRKAWNIVERDTRRYVMRAAGDVYVVTGVHFSGTPKKIGAGQVWVPSHIYKLVHDQARGRTWAHWMANSSTAQVGKPITYQQLVERTGMEFLPVTK